MDNSQDLNNFQNIIKAIGALNALIYLRDNNDKENTYNGTNNNNTRILKRPRNNNTTPGNIPPRPPTPGRN